ncbi:hypothetical protein GCM10009422_01880 [Brevundimonas kwangchunensis]|uniref:Uncharacterized protein n=1 Tax=Brevundimonas kwangchunensis TaxID=322163 RepID=A0ABN1GFX7_9CAUL
MKPSGWIGRYPACPGSEMILRAGGFYRQIFRLEDPHALETPEIAIVRCSARWASKVAKSRRRGLRRLDP